MVKASSTIVKAILFGWFMVGVSTPSIAQLAKGQPKFLGSSLGTMRPTFLNYFNQVTPENDGKWGSVEGVQGNFSFSALDNIYQFSVNNSFPYKHHNLVWGNQQPSWIASLDTASQRAEVKKWIDTIGARYGSTSLVDVVNEPLHAVPAYSAALGGAGATGWDWVVASFAMARHAFFPSVKLLINDYNILQSNSTTDTYIRIIDTLKVRHLIDGIGIQGHYFEFRSPAATSGGYIYPISTIQSNLNRLTALGLPVYISEFDINEPVDSIQLQNYQTYFPIFWENPGVAGITLWGYEQGYIWQTNGYLLRSNGTERPALQWLRRYLASPIKPVLASPLGTSGIQRNAVLQWHPSKIALTYRIQVATDGQFASLVADTTVPDTVARLSPLASNTQFFWHVSAVNDSGTSSYSLTGSFTTGDQILSVDASDETPLAFDLFQNYPNPFNPKTVISGQWTGGSDVRLVVYDVLGRQVASLANGRYPAGKYTFAFDGTDLASGVYFYRLTAGSYTAIRKMLLIR